MFHVRMLNRLRPWIHLVYSDVTFLSEQLVLICNHAVCTNKVFESQTQTFYHRDDLSLMVFQLLYHLDLAFAPNTISFYYLLP